MDYFLQQIAGIDPNDPPEDAQRAAEAIGASLQHLKAQIAGSERFGGGPNKTAPDYDPQDVTQDTGAGVPGIRPTLTNMIGDEDERAKEMTKEIAALSSKKRRLDKKALTDPRVQAQASAMDQQIAQLKQERDKFSKLPPEKRAIADEVAALDLKLKVCFDKASEALKALGVNKDAGPVASAASSGAAPTSGGEDQLAVEKRKLESDPDIQKHLAAIQRFKDEGKDTMDYILSIPNDDANVPNSVYQKLSRLAHIDSEIEEKGGKEVAKAKAERKLKKLNPFQRKEKEHADKTSPWGDKKDDGKKAPNVFWKKKKK